MSFVLIFSKRLFIEHVKNSLVWKAGCVSILTAAVNNVFNEFLRSSKFNNVEFPSWNEVCLFFVLWMLLQQLPPGFISRKSSLFAGDYLYFVYLPTFRRSIR